jgi:hypothetical protein
MGSSVTNIGISAFQSCSGLSSIVLPGSLLRIESSLFLACTGLVNITIGNGVTTIGSSAFQSCSGLSNIVLPNSLLSIENSVFLACSSLTNLLIPNSVTNIGDFAFQSCINLTSVTIPNNVIRIGNGAFSQCTGLKGIQVDPLNPVYTSLAGVLFDKHQVALLQYPAGKAGSYTIPDSVINIGDFSFSACASLTELMIPNSVRTVGNGAFAYCANLTSIAIPSSVTSIEGGAFYSCASLTNIALPNSVTTISGSLFASCSSLTNIAIPDSVTNIEDSAFQLCSSLTIVTIPESVRTIGYAAFNGCWNLSKVVFLGDPPIADWTAFFNDDNVTIYYKPGTTGWGTTYLGYPTILWDPLPQAQFDYMTNQGTITITFCNDSNSIVIVPDTIDGLPVTKIGDSAFNFHTNLTSVTIGHTVTNIGNYAFIGCLNPMPFRNSHHR